MLRPDDGEQAADGNAEPLGVTLPPLEGYISGAVATMLAATNDVFFGPKATGIALFDADGVALSGDIRDQLSLWDAGTEGNEVPAIGPNTVSNQLAPNTGTPGEGKVQLSSAVTTDTYSYPAPSSVLKVAISTK